MVKYNVNEPSLWHPGAAMLGWLLPGLGHVAIGQKRRGIIIGLTISMLWLSGLLIGGVSVIDRERSGIMYVGQVLVAPGIVVDYTMQKYFKIDGDPKPYAPHRFEPSFGRLHEHGMLYTSLAGLLNLLAMVDVLYREPRSTSLLEEDEEDADAKPEAAT